MSTDDQIGQIGQIGQIRQVRQVRRIRALYVQPAASFGGAERQAAQNIGLLPRFGVDVLPVVGPGHQIRAFLDDAGVRQYVFRDDFPDDPKQPRSPLGRSLLLAKYVRSYFRMTRAIEEEAKRFRAHVLFASRPFAWVVAGIAGERLGVPVVWRAGTEFESWVQPSILSWFARACPPRAVVYTSSAIRDAVQWAVPRAASVVLHNGVDTERFGTSRKVESLRRELAIPSDASVLGFVGRISPEKGIGLLVASCRLLRKMEPRVRLLVAGDSGFRARFEAALSASGLSDMVHLLGFVRDVERVYATADIIVSTSESEGCSNALLEAMAMGRPVVATAVGGNRGIIRDGIDGLLVEPGNARAFASAVAGLLAQPERQRALGCAAALRVAQHYAHADQVERLADVIRWAAGCNDGIANAPSNALPIALTDREVLGRAG